MAILLVLEKLSKMFFGFICLQEFSYIHTCIIKAVMFTLFEIIPNDITWVVFWALYDVVKPPLNGPDVLAKAQNRCTCKGAK